MRIIHTADWHIGRMLHQRLRYDEFAAFLDWMAETIDSLAADVLVVAGDIFDTGTPSNKAQELYYQFLKRAAESSLRHIVIVGGNHDSPSFLNAPRELLKAFDVHVVGSMTEDPADEVLVLRDQQGGPELIVCAVPYLRDRDIRTAEAGETILDKERKLIEGTREHYRRVAELAVQRRDSLGVDIPIIATGHLYTAGGKTVDGDGVRSLYVGTLAHVDAGIFPDCFDYVALGHLHVPQIVGGEERIRYSGSPIPMGFGEAGQQKSICLVDFAGKAATIQLHPIPVFRKLESIRGTWQEIEIRLRELKTAGGPAWLEISHQGSEVLGDFKERVEKLTKDTELEVLVRKDLARGPSSPVEQPPLELAEQTPADVFERCLIANKIPPEQWPELKQCFAEIVQHANEADPGAE